MLGRAGPYLRRMRAMLRSAVRRRSGREVVRTRPPISGVAWTRLPMSLDVATLCLSVPRQQEDVVIC